MSGAWRFSFLGQTWGFAQPQAFAWAFLVFAIVFLGIYLALKRKNAVAKMIAARHVDGLTRGVSTTRPLFQSLLYGWGLLCFVIALAQPQCSGKSEWTPRSGIDVVVALDASKSMYAQDVQPSRMQRAKLELTSLLEELKGDRVAIVAFAQEAFVQCPLTTDYSAARMFLNAVEPNQMPQGGTNLGAALRTSLEVLENADKGAKNRVVVLLTDGEDLTGDLDEALSALSEKGVRVLAVGIGSEEGDPVPIFDEEGNRLGFQKDREGKTVISRLDKDALKAIAERTDGKFFYVPRGVATVELARAIDSMQKSEFEGRLTVKYAEGFQYFLAPGLLALSLGMWLSTSRRKG